MGEAADLRTARHPQNPHRLSEVEWEQTRERNEALDCRVYARAAAWLMGIDRWDNARWEALEEQIRACAPGNHPRRSTPPAATAICPSGPQAGLGPDVENGSDVLLASRT